MLDDDDPPEAAESPGGGAPDDIVFDLGLTGELGKSSETLEETVAASAGLDLDTKSIQKEKIKIDLSYTSAGAVVLLGES